MTTTTDLTIHPFEVHVPEEDLADLRRRIAAWRPPEREPVDDQSRGVQLATVQDLASYWATEYDWRRCEAKLNALEQFITSIDGLDVHFIHVRSPQQNALPLGFAWLPSPGYGQRASGCPYVHMKRPVKSSLPARVGACRGL